MLSHTKVSSYRCVSIHSKDTSLTVHNVFYKKAALKQDWKAGHAQAGQTQTGHTLKGHIQAGHTQAGHAQEGNIQAGLHPGLLKL